MRRRERKGEIAMGLQSRLSRQIVFGGACTFPQWHPIRPRWGGRGPASMCVYTYGGEVDVLHLIDLCREPALMAHQGGLTAEPTSTCTHSHTFTWMPVPHISSSPMDYTDTLQHTHVSWHTQSDSTQRAHTIPSLHTDTPRCDICCVGGQFATVEPQGELLVCREFLCSVSVCSYASGIP